MGKIHWELMEIPIPDDAHINHNDGRVFIFIDDTSKVRESKRKTIGHATSETTMHPNDAFRYIYPGLWKEHYGNEQLPEHVIHSGLYALTLGIGYKTSIYPLLITAYGPLYANAILDFAMYSIREESDVVQTFQGSMSRRLLFSKESYSDTWYSLLFKEKMTSDMCDDFRDQWIKKCKERGMGKVWLSIDGSNNNCEAEKCVLSEKGKAKSGENTNVISYIYAVNAEDGCPVTYFVNNGGKVDSKAIQKLILYLHGHGIEVEGMILDRGFCNHDVFELLDRMEYPYIIMLKNDTYAHAKMIEEYSENIRMKVKYAIDANGLFGISSKRKVFANHAEDAYVSLYYDVINGSQRTVTLIGKVFDAVTGIKNAWNAGGTPAVPASVSKYLSLEPVNGKLEIVYNYDKWQEDVDMKGFCSIASSKDIGAAETNRIYHLRDASETQYMIMKSHMGYDVTRTHYTEGIENKLAVCFVASILRAEIVNACKKHKLNTSRMLRELDRIELLLLPNNIYEAVHDETIRQKELLAEFDIIPSDFNTIAKAYNQRRLDPISSQIHKKPVHDIPSKKKRGRPAGRKKGQSDINTESTASVKNKPGRPKGSKNKSTIKREAVQTNPLEKRRPGRPKGSKNKPKTIPVMEEKRGRGRPKGGKNKK